MSSDFDGHTPAPWAYTLEILADNLRLTGPGGTVIIGGCGCCGSPYMNDDGSDDALATAHANARLIAAAPDLLAERDRLAEVNAELVEALAGIIDFADRHSLVFFGSESDRRILPHARAALAKARGQA